jgi:hypothetical protein
MEFNIQIGDLAKYIEEYKGITLRHDCEENIKDLKCKINTPSGPTYINQIIKKENLQGIKIVLENKVEIKCAKEHILIKNNKDIFAKDLVIGDKIETKDGDISIQKIEDISDTTFYDIGIDEPHLYYDADGVLHHNTIITATLSKICEPFGRTLVVVPNKSLVTQTENDYRNCGLDVGVYFGDRKELGRTHTICTWQSLNILDKRNKNGEELLSLAEFLEEVSTIIIDECFDGDTLITTPQGKTPIKDLKAGDKVINLCEKTKQYKEDIVVKVHKNLTHSESEKMLELEFDNGITTKVTANHKFLTNKGWVRADELTKDLEIIDINTYG